MVTVNSINSESDPFTANSISLSQWIAFEALGCVFLPAAGFRNSRSVTDANVSGYYWTASLFSEESTSLAAPVWFNQSDVKSSSSFPKYRGFSVRLVRTYTSQQNVQTTSGDDTQTTDANTSQTTDTRETEEGTQTPE